jgi:hypothetical protein
MKMGKIGGIIAVFLNISYLIGAGISGYIIRDALKENKPVDTTLSVFLAMCLLMPIMILTIYLTMNKNTPAEKEKVNKIIGWTSMAHIIILLLIFILG